MSCLPKPVLRGHIAKAGLKMLLGSLAFATVNGTLLYYLLVIPRRQAYEKFLATYDADAHYKDLVKWGYLTFPTFLEEVKKARQGSS